MRLMVLDQAKTSFLAPGEGIPCDFSHRRADADYRVPGRVIE